MDFCRAGMDFCKADMDVWMAARRLSTFASWLRTLSKLSAAYEATTS